MRCFDKAVEVVRQQRRSIRMQKKAGDIGCTSGPCQASRPIRFEQMEGEEGPGQMQQCGPLLWGSTRAWPPAIKGTLLVGNGAEGWSRRTGLAWPRPARDVQSASPVSPTWPISPALPIAKARHQTQCDSGRGIPRTATREKHSTPTTAQSAHLYLVVDGDLFPTQAAALASCLIRLLPHSMLAVGRRS